MSRPARPSRVAGRREASAKPHLPLAAPGTSFAAFVDDHRRDLQRIAHATRGEYRLGDVVNEAWMLGHEWTTKHEVAADFGDAAFRQWVLSHLFQALVRYSDTRLRHADRLDQPAHTDDDRPNPLLARLVADDGVGPLDRMLNDEEAKFRSTQACLERGSLAAAWLALLDRYGDMRRVARQLLISVSHAYHCCARARETTAADSRP